MATILRGCPGRGAGFRNISKCAYHGRTIPGWDTASEVRGTAANRNQFTTLGMHIMAGNLIARSVHDLTAAAWFGGSLMGAIGLNGAAAQAKDPAERTR